MTQATEQAPSHGKALPENRSSDRGKAVPVMLEWRGAEKGSWERWIQSGEGAPSALAPGEIQPKHCRRILTLPTERLLAWPLWIAAEGDASELVKLELSGRHLLRRGMERTLRVLNLAESGGRRLVLAVADEEPFPEEGLPADWKTAERYTLRPLLLAGEGADLILWKENGLHFACLLRDSRPVWFGQLGEDLSPGLLMRTSLRLLSEGILTRPVRSISLSGDFSAASRETFSRLFRGARLDCSARLPSPGNRLCQNEDFPPAEAMAERRRRGERIRLRRIGAGIALLYLLFLLWAVGDHVTRRRALGACRDTLAALDPPARQARADSERWKVLRNAIDPSTYPLDLLAAVAAPTEGGKVRLTSFTLEKGRLQISGEATDVTQAYAFIDQLRKCAALGDFEWTAGQPQLAGKNSVKFDMEGVRPDATK